LVVFDSVQGTHEWVFLLVILLLFFVFMIVIDASLNRILQ